MTSDRKTPATVLKGPGGDEVVISDDGTASVTSTGGVEIVLGPDGGPRIAGLTAFGINDLAEVEAFATRREGDVTTHVIDFVGGGAVSIAFRAGKFVSYQGIGVSLEIRREETKAFISAAID